MHDLDSHNPNTTDRQQEVASAVAPSPIQQLQQELELERGAREDAEARLEETERLLEQAEDAASLRSQFLASMGHTLRTPLNSITGFAGILLEEACGPLNERQRQFVERIVESGYRQLELITNLMDLARLDAGQAPADPATVCAKQVVLGAVDEYRCQIEAKGLRLELQVDQDLGTLTVDTGQLSTALANLLSNAVRLTDQGGTVRVVATRVTPSGSQTGDLPQRLHGGAVVRIEVADTGSGITPEDMRFIFDDFEHTESLAARRHRRSGTGLALARRIVERHGGRIWAESEGVKGRGSRFVVELPSVADLRIVA
jgi:signal transduction histidine kinase